MKAKAKKCIATILESCFKMLEKWGYIFGIKNTDKPGECRLTRILYLLTLLFPINKDLKSFFMLTKDKILAMVLFTASIDQF
jgi:hypothetical protein